ncbi:MAG: hypothetical protein NVSMB65_14580 [Chloroflexota bacterium]
MIEFVHPCGHKDTCDERTWYEHGGDVPWECPVCQAQRARERARNIAYLRPLHTYLGTLGHQGSWAGEEDDPAFWTETERALEAIATAAAREVRARTVAAIQAGLTAVTLARAEAVAPPPDAYDRTRLRATPPLDVEQLLDRLSSQHALTHNALWCAENGIPAQEGRQAFWVIDVYNAEEALAAEVTRRLLQRADLQDTPTSP